MDVRGLRQGSEVPEVWTYGADDVCGVDLEKLLDRLDGSLSDYEAVTWHFRVFGATRCRYEFSEVTKCHTDFPGVTCSLHYLNHVCASLRDWQMSWLCRS